MPHCTARALGFTVLLSVALVVVTVGCQEPLAKYQSGGAVASQTTATPVRVAAEPAVPSTEPDSDSRTEFLSASDSDYQWFAEHYRREVKLKMPRPLTAEFGHMTVMRELSNGATALQGLGGVTYLDNVGEPVKLVWSVRYRQAGGGWELANVQVHPEE